MTKKLFLLLSIVLISAICLSSLPVSVSADDAEYIIVDFATDKAYSITCENFYLYVKQGTTERKIPFKGKLSGCSVYNGVLAFYEIYANSSDDFSLITYFYDYADNEVSKKVINSYAWDNPYCFTADKYGNIYFTSDMRPNVLCIANGDKLDKTMLTGDITQIMCLDGRNVLLITTLGLYVYCDGFATKSENLSIKSPCKYIGDNKIRDADGEMFTYDNGKVSPLSEKNTESTENTHSRADEYIVCEEGTTVAVIKKKFQNVSGVMKCDGSEIKSGRVGTGAVICFDNNSKSTVIIQGELTGEGNINSKDIKAVLDQLSGKALLKGSFLKAADMDGNKEITTVDAYKILNKTR